MDRWIDCILVSHSIAGNLDHELQREERPHVPFSEGTTLLTELVEAQAKVCDLHLHVLVLH